MIVWVSGAGGAPYRLFNQLRGGLTEETSVVAVRAEIGTRG